MSAPKYCVTPNGAGIFNQGELTLSNVTVHGNFASGGWCGPNVGTAGGGIFSEGPLTLSNVTVFNNTACVCFASHRAVRNADAVCWRERARHARRYGYGGPYSTGSAFGGGIASTSTVDMRDSSVYANAAHGAGGGFGGGFFCSGQSTVVRSSFRANLASAYGGRRGCGVFNDGQMDLVGCTLTDNTAAVVLGSAAATGGGGGGGVGNDGTLHVRDTTVLRNVVVDFGGGVESSSTLVLSNVTVMSNSAAKGDAHNYGVSSTGTLNEEHCTIANNTRAAEPPTVDLREISAALPEPAQRPEPTVDLRGQRRHPSACPLCTSRDTESTCYYGTHVTTEYGMHGTCHADWPCMCDA
jgi:hypothetical protein